MAFHLAIFHLGSGIWDLRDLVTVFFCALALFLQDPLSTYNHLPNSSSVFSLFCFPPFPLALSPSSSFNIGHFSKRVNLARIPFPSLQAEPRFSCSIIYLFIWEHIPFIIKFHLGRPQAPVCDCLAFSWLAPSFLPPIASRR